MANTNRFKTIRNLILIAVPVLALDFQDSWAQDEPNPTELIKKMEVASGTWNKLWEQKDVEFDYDYHYPKQNIKDVSKERYIFEGEHSWARYTQHDINVMPGTGGIVIQSLVNNEAKCTHYDKVVIDEKVVGTTDFLRRANFFWFTMMFKLNNPGAIHEYLGKESLNGINYDKVKVYYDSDKTGKELNDTYILYINPKTNLVDEFYFSLPDFGIINPVLKMVVQYEEINGLKLPTKRLIYQPGKDGKLPSEPDLIQTSSNVKFNNGFKPEDFKL